MESIQDSDLELQDLKGKMKQSISSGFEIHPGILYRQIKYQGKQILVLCLPYLLCKEVINKSHSTIVPPIRSEFSDFGPNSDFFEPTSPNLV